MTTGLKRNLISIAALTVMLHGASHASGTLADAFPQYATNGQLIKPANYREWVLVSTGLGMAYDPLRSTPNNRPPFTNVFVNPSSYQKFMQTGTWPDKTIFILEGRESIALNNSATGSNGYYQGEITGIEAHVKDTSHFNNRWAFFSFGTTNNMAMKIPEMVDCYSCHAKNSAVDTTFVQFYPVLRDVAKEKGTFKAVPNNF